LTGHPPFERRTELAAMMAQVSDPVPPMQTTAPDLVLPPGLEGVVMRCLAKNLDDRWGSMEDLLLALQDRTVPALTVPGPVERVMPPPDQHQFRSSIPVPAAREGNKGRLGPVAAVIAAVAVVAVGAVRL